MSDLKLAIVVPCYNEEAVLRETTVRLTEVIDQLVEASAVCPHSFILYVSDGSTDATWSIIEELHRTTPYVRGLKLARNSGHQNALMAGLSAGKELADVLVSIDADLQDDVMAIPEMITRYADGADIVYGVRRERKSDTWFKRNTALMFYRVMRFMGIESVYNHADYRLMSRRAVEYLCRFRERNLFLRGIIPLVGYHTACVYYNRGKRFAGESKYPFRKMLSFAVNGITSFSVKPIRMFFFLGLMFLLIAFATFCYVIYSYIRHQAVEGWASLMLSLWFIGGCIMTGIGVIGEYLGKIYIEVKDRPRYNVEEELL
ncbi:MAG: glycosyltransferase family 2 protein [Mediterranea sp.]|jgi:glycosyltransferase involved in cell wall biosynthesis|nr:glycosyltransferase family 2 protein [Mediterranea sp.]